MADLAKIKVGDKLRLELTVTDLDLRDRYRPVEAEDLHWLAASEVEAAEHIPAPKIFKRGDWVKWADEDEEHRKCLVLGGGATDVAKLRGLLRVDVPGEGVCEIHPRALESDEAPK